MKNNVLSRREFGRISGTVAGLAITARISPLVWASATDEQGDWQSLFDAVRRQLVLLFSNN